MTTGQRHGEQWSRGARDWAQFMEPNARPFYDRVHEVLHVSTGTRLLDIGCGPGGAVWLAAQRGARVAGLDAAPDSVAVARERVPEGDFRVGDMEQLPWPNAAFDAVTGFNSFPFAGNPVAALLEARRVLAPGGRLGLVVWAPPEASQQPIVMRAISTLAPPQPGNGPGPFALSQPGAVEAALEAAGFQAEERGEVVTMFAFPDAETACKAMLAGSGAARAIPHVGEARVRQVLLDALAAFRNPTGSYRLENRFRFVIASLV